MVGDDGVAASSRAYGRLIEAAAGFATDAFRLALRHRDDYLRSLVPADRLAVRPPVPLPPVPRGGDAADWWAWYQLVAGWVGQEQAWAAAAYRAIVDEAAAGRLAPDALEVSARAYLQRRLDAYASELSDLYSRFVSDVMSAAGEWLGGPAGDTETEPDAGPVVLDVRGPAGSTAVTAVLIENGLGDRATVSCVAASTGGFALAAEPSELELDQGGSARVAVEVTFPPRPTAGPASVPLLAGWITIRGHGQRDLVAKVHAFIEPSPPAEAPAT